MASLIRQKVLASQITDSGQWFTKARGLAMAAKEVEPSVLRFWQAFDATERGVMRLRLAAGPSTHTAYFLLSGFSIENYLKGLLVHKDPAAVERSAKRGNSQLAKVLGGHDLLKISKKADVAITVREEQLLFRFTANILWAGRYPYPLRGDDQAVCEIFPDGQKRDIRLRKNHITSAGKLIERLERVSQALDS